MTHYDEDDVHEQALAIWHKEPVKWEEAVRLARQIVEALKNIEAKKRRNQR